MELRHWSTATCRLKMFNFVVVLTAIWKSLETYFFLEKYRKILNQGIMFIAFLLVYG
jgi:hypothetical protein